MAISDFFDTEVTVNRSVWQTDGSGNEYSAMASQGTEKAHIQQADPQLVEHLGLSFTKTFAVWVSSGADVQEGDELVHGSWVYHVKAIQDYDTGNHPHKQVLCQREVKSV